MWSRWLIALPLAIVVGCNCNGGGFADAPPDNPPPGGTFSLAWQVTDVAGAPIPCDRVGGQTVSVAVSNPDSAGEPPEAFTCRTQSGTSRVLDVGSYSLSFELTGAGGARLATAPARIIPIESGRTTEVAPASAPLAFPVDATGALTLTLDTNVPGGNCASGAGITSLTIRLFHFDDQQLGGCEPVTFGIAPPGGTGGSYTVNCASPQTISCIDSNQVLSVPVMSSGTYRIEVRGKVGAQTCWVNDDTFAVPPLGGMLTTRLNLGKTC